MGYLSIVFYVVAFNVLLLAGLIARYRQPNEGGMEWRSFLFGKGAFLVSPEIFPQNNSENAAFQRQKIDFISSSVIFPVQNFIQPKLSKIPYQDIHIPVTPHADAFTNAIQDKILIRIYSSPSATTAGALKPVLVWYHGGGWVVGSAIGDHVICTQLALYSNYLVVNVDYRLAPNYPFPIPALDAYEALHWISEHITAYGGDPQQLIVGGESAGGNLAAAMVYQSLKTTFHLLTDSIGSDMNSRKPLKGKIVGALLVCSALDSRTDNVEAEQFGNANGAVRIATGKWFRQLYQGSVGWQEAIRSDPLFAPMHTPSELLQHFPPTVFVLAGYDSLTPENKRFARLLEAANRSVSLLVYPTTIHWFYSKSVISAYGSAAVVQSIEALEKVIH